MKKHNPKLLGISIALVLTACATQQAGQWQQIGTTEQGSVVYSVDKSSIQRNGQ